MVHLTSLHVLICILSIQGRVMSRLTLADLPENCIANAVHEALAPYEVFTSARLDNLQNLLTSLTNSIQARFSNSTNSPAKQDQSSLQKSGALYSVPTQTQRYRIACNVCKQSFQTLTLLDNHIESNHKALICRDCGKTLRSQPDFNYHHHKHHASTATCVPLTDLEQHVELRPDPDEYSNHDSSCEVRDKTLSSSPDLSFHEQTPHYELATTVLCSDTVEFLPRQKHACGDIECYVCGKSFITSSDLQLHIELNHADALGSSVIRSNPPQSHACDLCTCTFFSTCDLDNHINTYHTPPIQSMHTVSFSCYDCESLFPSQALLQEHLQTKHGITTTHACPICQNIFISIDYLNIHRETCHASHVSLASTPLPLTCLDTMYNHNHTRNHTVHCNSCEETFQEMRLLNIHVMEHHSQGLVSPSQCSIEDISDILQVDGVDDITADSIEVRSTPPDLSNVSKLVANYSLNQNKQLVGLAKHSKLQNFEITINDNAKNVSIQCSTGFYEAVAKPAFASLSKGFQLEISSVLVECIEIRNTLDLSNSLPGSLLKFKLHGTGVTPVPASVSVHLHNTQQKVQLQGGAKMSDQSTAAVWFTQKILKQRFINEAQNKKLNIEEINKAVSGLSVLLNCPSTGPGPDPPDTCHHCSKKFSTKSRPIICTRCSQYKHTTRCSPCPASLTSLLTCYRDTSPTLMSSTLNAPASLASPMVSAPSSTSTSTFSVVTPVSSTTVSETSPKTSSQQPTTITIEDDTSLSSPPNKKSRNETNRSPGLSFSQPSSIPASSASPTVSTLVHPHGPAPSTSAQSEPSNRKRKNNLKTSSKTPEQLEIDYLKIELNRVRT